MLAWKEVLLECSTLDTSALRRARRLSGCDSLSATILSDFSVVSRGLIRSIPSWLRIVRYRFETGCRRDLSPRLRALCLLE